MGLSGDLDRLPLLTWIRFLRFLDDLEVQSEDEAKLVGKTFKPAIEPPSMPCGPIPDRGGVGVWDGLRFGVESR